MMFRKVRVPLVFLLFSLTLLSCERITSIEKIVVNSSSQAITVVVEQSETSTRDSFLVAAGSQASISEVDEIGINKDAPDCTEGFIHLSIALQPGDSLLKDPMSSGNWNTTSEKISRGHYAHTCTYTLTDADIQ